MPLESKNSLEKKPPLQKLMPLADEEPLVDEVVDHSNEDDSLQKKENIASRRNYACTVANQATLPSTVIWANVQAHLYARWIPFQKMKWTNLASTMTYK